MFAILAVERNLYFLKNSSFRFNPLEQKISSFAFGIFAIIGIALLGFKYLKDMHHKEALRGVKILNPAIFLLKTGVLSHKLWNCGKQVKDIHAVIKEKELGKKPGITEEYAFALKSMHYEIIKKDSKKEDVIETRQLKENEIRVIPLKDFDKNGHYQIKAF